MGSDPRGGAKIQHASWPKKQNIKHRSNTVTYSTKTKKWSHQKKKKKNGLKNKGQDMVEGRGPRQRSMSWRRLGVSEELHG